MNSTSRLSRANFALALATGMVLFALAAAQIDPAAAAETRYLATLVTAVLLAAAGLAVLPARELMVGAVLAALIVWVVPAGPTRGAAIGLVLVGLLLVAALRRWLCENETFGVGSVVALALGVQLLSRSDQLLAGQINPRTLFGLLVLPLAAAAALAILRRQGTAGQVLVAAGAVAVLAPGWSVAVVLSLLSIAAGTSWGESDTPRFLRVVALAVLLGLASAWHPSLPWLLVLCALAMAAGESWKPTLLTAAGAGVALLFLPAARSWSETLHLLALLPLLLPTLATGASARRLRLGVVVLLTILALRTIPLPGALAGPLALGVLSLRTRGAQHSLQQAWSAVLLTGTLVFAAYPWLRPQPLADLLGVLGLGLHWWSAVAVTIVVVAIGALFDLASQWRQQTEMRPVAVGLLVLAFAAYLNLPAVGRQPLGGKTLVLSSERPELTWELEPSA
jgi:hypothetical protein